MMSQNIIIRGLEQNELERLDSLAEEMNMGSRNTFLLFLIRQYLEQDIASIRKDVHVIYLDEILEVQEKLLTRLEEKEKMLNQINERLNKMSDLTCRWLDFNEF